MFAPSSASDRKARAATPVWERMPTPIAELHILLAGQGVIAERGAAPP